ncbi:MAG: ATP-binding protein [bacterium]|nr:ATP-binding protein [bacterium]
MKALLKRLSENRFRISTQLYAGIWAAVALTMAAGMVGWFSFNRVGEAQNVVNDDTLPEMATAFRVAQFSSNLVDAAPRLATAISQNELIDIAAGIAATNDSFVEQLDELEKDTGDTEQYQQLRIYSESLISNIAAIYNDKVELFGLATDKEDVQDGLATVRVRLDSIMLPVLDDQFSDIISLRASGDSATSTETSFFEDQMVVYRSLTEIRSNANIAAQLLATALGLSDSSEVEPLRGLFKATVDEIEAGLSNLNEFDQREDLQQFSSQLSTLGLGTNGGFNLVARELGLLDRQNELLANNRVLALNMVNEIDVFVNAARERADGAALASDQAMRTGRTLLLFISIVSVAGAALMAWLFVGRVLLRRLSHLSNRMLSMAKGDLETQVTIKGRDEVADLAEALEVFRRHALEVQRLNLVEQLATELKEKNSQIEKVLSDLQRAQEQIVVQGKLAALGELTAGVAHEFRNPLNFIRNFSEASKDLLAELREILDEPNGDRTEEDRVYLLEIADYLESNLERIRSHGDRADRIVEDMLRMGGGSGAKQATDLNRVMHDRLNLAYQSARAMDADFNLNISEDYDPTLVEMEVIPQDIGRLFLNLVSNACYATNQRRLTIEASGEQEPFAPELRISSCQEADRVVFRVWDNGGGIPSEIIDDIFNPFFTTKPADQGTGLGLALSSDIARQHGGLIRVETEQGESTTMIVELPLADAPAPTPEIHRAG